MRRSAVVTVCVVELSFFSVNTSAAANKCATGANVEFGKAELRASPGAVSKIATTNPFPPITADEKAKGRTTKLCWLSEQQVKEGKKCDDAPREELTRPFEIARCSSGVPIQLAENAALGDLSAEDIVIVYQPPPGSTREDVATLRVESTGGETAAKVEQFTIRGHSHTACSTGGAVLMNGVTMEAGAGSVGRQHVTNPLDTAAGEGTFCWVTPAQQASNTECASAMPRAEATRVFELERCDDGQFATIAHGARLADIRGRDLFVTYRPPEGDPRTDAAFLRFESKDSQSKVSVLETAAVEGKSTPTFDPLYRIGTYLGSTSSFSQDDFGKAFPELRVLVESRIVDGYEKCLSERSAEQCAVRGDRRFRFPDYWNLRLYGDAGLTSTVVSQEGEAPNFKARRGFDGSAGIGYGGSYNRATRQGAKYTNRFSYALLFRLGAITVPAKDNAPGDHHFHNFTGLHIENENGYYEGAYFETGVGRSDQFTFHQYKRWKTAAFVPFMRPGTVRLALRLQTDFPAPWASFKAIESLKNQDGTPIYDPNEPDPTKRAAARQQALRLRKSGDIKITFLVTIDIKKAFGFAGAGGTE